MRAAICSVGVALLLLSASPASSRPTLTCRDGVLANVILPGGTVVGVCDADGRADGTCTYIFRPRARQVLGIPSFAVTVLMPVGPRPVVPIRAGRFALRCASGRLRPPE